MKRYPNELQQLSSVLESYLKRKTILALGHILNEPINHLLKIEEKEFSEFDSWISDSEITRLMSAACVKCSGDVDIGALWYVDQTDLRSLIEKLLIISQKGKFDKLAISSISEIGNILTASIANAIHADTGCKIFSSPPGYAMDSLKTLLEFVASDLYGQHENVIASNVEFFGTSSGIKVHMLLIQDRRETKKLLAQSR